MPPSKSWSSDQPGSPFFVEVVPLGECFKSTPFPLRVPNPSSRPVFQILLYFLPAFTIPERGLCSEGLQEVSRVRTGAGVGQKRKRVNNDTETIHEHTPTFNVIDEGVAGTIEESVNR